VCVEKRREPKKGLNDVSMELGKGSRSSEYDTMTAQQYQYECLSMKLKKMELSDQSMFKQWKQMHWTFFVQFHRFLRNLKLAWTFWILKARIKARITTSLYKNKLSHPSCCQYFILNAKWMTNEWIVHIFPKSLFKLVLRMYQLLDCELWPTALRNAILFSEIICIHILQLCHKNPCMQ
jgi:hypothetical protein